MAALRVGRWAQPDEAAAVPDDEWSDNAEGTMVDVAIENSMAIFTVRGPHWILAFKRRLAIPLAHVTDVRAADPAVTRAWWKGLRLPGTHIPGVIVAGTFYKDGKRTFWDVRDPAGAIVVDLDGEAYHQLIVEVDDPAAEIARFQAAPLT